jgi:hypothetical protein
MTELLQYEGSTYVIDGTLVRLDESHLINVIVKKLTEKGIKVKKSEEILKSLAFAHSTNPDIIIINSDGTEYKIEVELDVERYRRHELVPNFADLILALETRGFKEFCGVKVSKIPDKIVEEALKLKIETDKKRSIDAWTMDLITLEHGTIEEKKEVLKRERHKCENMGGNYRKYLEKLIEEENERHTREINLLKEQLELLDQIESEEKQILSEKKTENSLKDLSISKIKS